MEGKKNINPHLRIVRDEPPDLSKDISIENVQDLYDHLLDTFNLISEHLENEKEEAKGDEKQQSNNAGI